MIAESQSASGRARRPAAPRHGRTRRCRSYQASRSVGCGDETAARLFARCFPTTFAASVLPAIHTTLRATLGRGMTERCMMNKPARPFAKQLRDIAGKIVGESFRRQGFASAELVTRWREIAGAEIAACSEPLKIQWQRTVQGEDPAAGTLVLRVEGPAAIEIQHFANLICERVNQSLGWRAVGRLASRQAPLRRGASKKTRAADPAAAARIAETLSDIGDDDLKAALARLGAAIK